LLIYQWVTWRNEGKIQKFLQCNENEYIIKQNL
jgi:hypothetical protein